MILKKKLNTMDENDWYNSKYLSYKTNVFVVYTKKKQELTSKKTYDCLLLEENS